MGEFDAQAQADDRAGHCRGVSLAKTSPSGSVRQQLRGQRRILALMAVLMPVSALVGALGIARIAYATDTFGSSNGVGLIALVIAIAGAVMGVPAGVLVDRWDTRKALVLSVGGLAVVDLLLAVILLTGSMTPALALSLAAPEGLMLSLFIPAMANTQAALVPSSARGATEILNTLRNGVGGLIGVLVAKLVVNDGEIFLLAAIVTAACAAGAWWVSRPTDAQPVVTADPTSGPAVGLGAGLGELLSAIRAQPRLQASVTADVVMRIVVPTQLVALFVVDRQILDSALLAVAAGVVGVLLGNVALATRGISGNLSRTLLAVFSAYAGTLVIGFFLLTDDWLIGQALLMACLITLGSGFSAYGLGLIAALNQQWVPDEVRGRLTGVMASIRMIATSVGIVLATYAIGVWDTRLFVGVLLGLLACALTALQGFGRIGRES
ncbi:MAG: hypothetical protein CK552_06195 [Actinobacteria bacterium]|nr:MAG: hypothetical protein CK552_06195 [Actinomycetota bacterium]